MPDVQFEPIGQISIPKHIADGYVPGDPNSPSHPAYIFLREHAGHVWLVATASLLGDPRWREVHEGKHVMIPLVPYLTDPAPELLFGFGLQLAAVALANLPFPVLSVQLALGRPAEDVLLDYEGGQARQFRIHAGIALRVK